MICKYKSKCNLYSPTSPVCSEQGGMYYGYNKPAGCYRDMENSLGASHHVKQNLILLVVIAFIIVSILPAYAVVESFGTGRTGQIVNLVQTYNASYCNITSITSPNSTIYNGGLMTKNGVRFSYAFSDTNETGVYAVCGECDGSVWCGNMQITPNGQLASTGIVIFYIGLLGILILFLVLSLSAMRNYNHLLAKVGMLGLSYLLLTAITFIGWNMASDFLTSSPFLIEMLRILFFVFIIGAFPLLIGAFAWYVVMLFRIKEIERLMDKGIGEEEAHRRTGRKYK